MLQPGTGAIVSPECQADELLPYDARLRCACTGPSSVGHRCIRQATEEDRLCDDCRDDFHASMIRYVTLPALRDYPERLFEVLDQQRGHALLVAPLGTVLSDGLQWPL